VNGVLEVQPKNITNDAISKIKEKTLSPGKNMHHII